ncbi:hypothetical protein ACEQ8H_002557 [Pleosporales sp. CAS-2024a]
MSYDPRRRPDGASGTRDNADAGRGSVKAARQRQQAAQMRTQLPDTSRVIGLPQRPNQLLLPYGSRSGAVEQPRDPSPPQWPLSNDDSPMSGFAPMIPPRSPKRVPPLQRNDRPLSDDYPIQQLSPAPAQPMSAQHLQPPSPKYRAPSPSDELLSPSMHRSSRPLTTSSMASEASSLGSIPDFPVPQPPVPALQQQNQQARRTSSLGPPPSSRRGPSSYYTQMSYVSPIAEESDARSSLMRSRHGSYASSNVFPTHPDDFYENDDLFSDDASTTTSERGPVSPSESDDRRGLVQQSPALLRQASLGRRTKPSLMTIKSLDSLGKGKSDDAKYGAGAAVGGGGAAAIGTGTTSSSSSSLRNMQLAGAYGMDSSQPSSQEDMRASILADRKRPPRLDMGAVREAEARGSLTSLPELIRRATRLAANLDRGKTASRLGLDFWEAGTPDQKDGRQSGLSDMLAAFPPPGQDTPHSPVSKWPSAQGDSGAGATDSPTNNKEKPKRRRKCCGMPLWTFVTLLTVLLLVTAAAVVIPVVLVVLPNQNKSSKPAVQEGQSSGASSGRNGNGNGNGNGNSIPSIPPHRPAPTLPSTLPPTLAPGNNQCSDLITCNNGGISILNADRTCNCVCINGFTGSTCTNNDATGCTTSTIPGTASNATMGTAISRLLDQSAANKSMVPLNSTRVLSLFSELSLSCAAQNALVTFNGLASRSVDMVLHAIDMGHALEPSPSFPILHNPHAAAHGPEQIVNRQAIGAAASASPAPAPAPAVTKAAPSSAAPTQPVSSNVEALDFARIGVLFALQQTGQLDVAANAQESVQSFLTSNRNKNGGDGVINMGPFKMDLFKLTITLTNGTVIGEQPSSS